MKQRRLLRFHNLKRPRVRQTWNKYNLFNLFRQRTPMFSPKTFFQQKWAAKSMTRSYHGEHIKEYQWERMFSRRLLSAVNMNPSYMARYNGSEQAAGRGSGLAGNRIRNEGDSTKPTPYMQMTYAPMERRLDIAIFRALFASSARQARQFVLHGAVTVNGKKMTYPGYLLNPGDMFQVEIERVMAATGQPRPPYNKKKALPSSESAETEPEADAEEAEGGEEAVEGGSTTKQPDFDRLHDLKKLAQRARAILDSKDKEIKANRKRRLRQFLHIVKRTEDRRRASGEVSDAELASTEKELSSLLETLTLSPSELREKKRQRDFERAQQEAKEEILEQSRRDDDSSSSSSSSRSDKAPDAAADANNPTPQTTTTTTPSPTPATPTNTTIVSPQERALLEELMLAEAENPHDFSKPYATPWKPRDWMAPFAFVPRYLEVNQRICAAVYLRHPVARPGRAEVPSPFEVPVSQLAFNWYLRRR